MVFNLQDFSQKFVDVQKLFWKKLWYFGKEITPKLLLVPLPHPFNLHFVPFFPFPHSLGHFAFIFLYPRSVFLIVRDFTWWCLCTFKPNTIQYTVYTIFDIMLLIKQGIHQKKISVCWGSWLDLLRPLIRPHSGPTTDTGLKEQARIYTVTCPGAKIRSVHGPGMVPCSNLGGPRTRHM